MAVFLSFYSNVPILSMDYIYIIGINVGKTKIHPPQFHHK